MGMTINRNKTEIMIIKYKNITYDNFIYDNSLEQVPSYKYLGINIHHKFNWNYSIEKRINRGWKTYYGFEKNCKSIDLWFWDKRNILSLSSLLLFYMDMRFGVVVYPNRLGGRLNRSKNTFISYNLKIKGNTFYHILLIKEKLSLIESMAMTRYLMYKKNLYNMTPSSFLKFLQTLAKTPTFGSREGDIRMPNLGWIIGE